MKTQTPTEKALAFLRNHFWGIGEDHPDFQEGIQAVDCLEKSIPCKHSQLTLQELLLKMEAENKV